MNSTELAAEVTEVAVRCQRRILGVGKDQYERVVDGVAIQHFEEYPLGLLFRETLEEIEDSINHLVMLHVRVRRIGEKARRLAESE